MFEFRSRVIPISLKTVVTASRIGKHVCGDTIYYFSAKGNIELFANNKDSGESARNELSHLKSALFGV